MRDSDRIYPSAQSRFSAETAEVPEDPLENLLAQILGTTLIARESPGNAQNHAQILPNEFPLAVGFPSQASFNQSGLIHFMPH